jgi:prenyltransferase beta subunit
MAFMARGHVPGQGPYGTHINKAVDYVISIQQSDGSFSSRSSNVIMYEQGIATVMLCEAYGMLDDRRQRAAHDAISKAVRLILRAQSVAKSEENRGGWRYLPASTDSDLSVSGWQLMALRGAANIGANVPEAALVNGIAYIKRCHDKSGGFAYANGRVTAALTGTGIVALELLGQHHTKEALAGGDYLLANSLQKKTGIDAYFYTVYYCSQAAWQLGGRYWEALNPTIRQSLLSKQRPDGAWSPQTIEQQGGETYGTAMAVLALTVPYRYLPIYQR